MGSRTAALVVLFASASCVAAQLVMTCGSGYMDASNNCADRPRCPQGDAALECMAGQTCFAIPVGNCAGEPTPSPTKAPVFVCGSDSADAKAGCSDGIRCPGGSGAECPAGMGCYPITWLDCGYTTTTTEATAPETTKATTTTTETTTEEPTQPAQVEMATVAEEAMPVESKPAPAAIVATADEAQPAQTAQPDPVPVSETLRLCGSDYADATLCALAAECPLGDAKTECPMGYDCFDIPASECVTAEPTMAPVPTTPVPSRSPVIPPLNVCASSYEEAVESCNDYEECVNGDCPSGEFCWSLPVEYCPEKEAEAVAAEEAVAPATSPAVVADEAAAVAADEAVAPAISPVLSVCATSFMDAKVKCVDPSKDCSATGLCDSDASEACFRVAREDCAGPVSSSSSLEVVEEVIVTTVPAVAVAQTEPTEPAVVETAEPATTETPSLLFVCGSDYADAQDNICTNESCSTVNECKIGGCYAMSYVDCSATTTTEAPPATASKTDNEADVTSIPAVPETPAPSLSFAPTKAPIVNTLFCGADYNDAIDNCWSAVPCPGGVNTECPSGQECYPIGAECVSPEPTAEPTVTGPQPTDSPTITSSPTFTPTISHEPTTASPTAAPVVNTNFCGDKYMLALENCSESTSCPTGICPGSQICYTGIACANPPTVDSTPNPPNDIATNAPIATPGAEAVPAQPAPVPSPATTAATDSPVAADGQPGDLTSNPTTFWSMIAGGLAESKKTSSPVASPPGLTSSPVPPTPNPTRKAFDPSVTHYCGTDYTEAVAGCYTANPCPSMSNAECPGGTTCYEVGICPIPPPTTSSPSLRPSANGGMVSMAAGADPTASPSGPPQLGRVQLGL